MTPVGAAALALFTFALGLIGGFLQGKAIYGKKQDSPKADKIAKESL